VSSPRYVVGIDLGTTNCAVAYVDTKRDDAVITPFALPQVVAPGEVDSLPTLPSFLLLPGKLDVAEGALALPWARERTYAAGAFARDRGAELPHRLVASAKSWLCISEVDLTEPILPWRGPASAAADNAQADEDDGAERISPVDAAARYLEHIRDAWQQQFAEAPLPEQEILLTVPASFDAVARELTVQAARRAGLERVTLLEEPQAAFYSWLAASGERWRKILHPGDVVLVCDVGGGTTDFSLIEVTDEDGSLVLERVAVGDHILLGGDNMDLALGHLLATRLEEDGKKLSAKQRAALVHACRRGKEQLLSDPELAAVPIAVLGGGSKLIGGTRKTELTRADTDAVVLQGFCPQVGLDATPKTRRQVGLSALGLPYAADAGITRHLAQFLARHHRQPTAVLFNGGVMQSAALRDRLSATVSSWYGGTELSPLAGTDLNLAVAHGAAYYGLVRGGKGVRIRGGLARSYYIGVDSAAPAIPGFEPPVSALCLVPAGLEEGSSVNLPQETFALIVGEVAEFPFFASTQRKEDVPGTMIEVDANETAELGPLKTRLDAGAEYAAGQRVPVALSANITEVGTLELWCEARKGTGRWKLEYSVRDTESE
jgi:molecular chaperone DnaK (HSP70)